MASKGTDSKDASHPFDPATVRVCKTVREKGRKSRSTSISGDQFEGDTKYAVVKQQAASSPKPRPSLKMAFPQRSNSLQTDALTATEHVANSQGRQRFYSQAQVDTSKLK